MNERSEASQGEPSLAVRLLFCGIFFLPMFYAVCVQLPFDQSEALSPALRQALGWGLIVALIGSLLFPIAVILGSSQSRIAKLGLCISCVVAWVVVQFTAALAIGFAGLMHSGFEGIQ